MRRTPLLVVTLVLGSVVGTSPLAGCEGKKSSAEPSAKHDGHDHDHGPGGEHTDDHARSHGGAIVALGEQTVGSFVVKASRDEGTIAAGKDAPFDVTVTPAAGSNAKVAAVRLWIGTQDGKGSVKARAEIEDQKEPNRWHTHVEVPSPMPADARLWAEIETEGGEKQLAGFDLKV